MQYTADEMAWVILSSVDGVGSATMQSIMKAYGSATAALDDATGLQGRFRLTDQAVSELIHRSRQSYREAYFARLDKLGILALGCNHPLYPKRLLSIHRPPSTLYVMGNPSLLNPLYSVAVVGTRHPTRYGQAMAGTLSRDLAQAGVSVVSGMARGIDGMAHAACMDAGGATIAVLGNGVNIPYPKENESLYQRILEHGVLVSEYLPGTQPIAQHFPARNRIISGLVDAVLVVEAGENSGTSITVEHALQQGRSVYAVPGRANEESAYTTNVLLRDGAGLVTCADDLLFGMQWIGSRRGTAPMKEELLLSDEEAILVKLLRQGEMSRDALLDETDIPISRMGQLLVGLENRGVIESIAWNIYAMRGK